MGIIDVVAIIGAAAWAPQIITWGWRALTKPKVSLYLYPQAQIGYIKEGPVFNVTLALLSEKKDAILNNLTANIVHENGASYTFNWVGLSEALSEIENPMGPTMSIKKTLLPLVIKVLHTGVAQALVRFQRKQFHERNKKVFTIALDRFNLLKKSDKLKREEDIDALVKEKEFDDVMKFYNSEFIWTEGRYKVTFDFDSPNKCKYDKIEYTFNLSQDDIDGLRKNIDNMQLDIIQRAKREIIPDYKSEIINMEWKYPELRRMDN